MTLIFLDRIYMINRILPQRAQSGTEAVLASAWGGLRKILPWPYSKYISVFVPKRFFHGLPAVQNRSKTALLFAEKLKML
jgi:hypothetical protein